MLWTPQIEELRRFWIISGISGVNRSGRRTHPRSMPLQTSTPRREQWPPSTTTTSTRRRRSVSSSRRRRQAPGRWNGTAPRGFPPAALVWQPSNNPPPPPQQQLHPSNRRLRRATPSRHRIPPRSNSWRRIRPSIRSGSRRDLSSRSWPRLSPPGRRRRRPKIGRDGRTTTPNSALDVRIITTH